MARGGGGTILSLDDVRFAHPQRPPVFDGLDLDVQPGQALHLEGASGSGKSTLLRLACGLIPRVHGGRIGGQVTLHGTPVTELAPPEIARRVGYVPQDPETAFVARTVEHELAGLLANAGVPEDEVQPRLAQALAAFDAHHLEAREVATLSGGEAARVALAAATAAEAELLLLDEPHAQLDADGREALASTLRGLRAGGRAMLIAAHEPHPFGDVVDRALTLEADAPRASPVPLPDPPGGDPVLVLDGVRHGYEDDADVGPIDLTVGPGEIVALRGPNGSGKTTALHAAAGLIEPDAGTARLSGEDPRGLEATERARRLGIAFQHPAWHITQDTLADEVALTSRRLGLPIDARAWLAHMGLGQRARAHPWDLSGGERQRMAVLTALAHGPEVALLDEPTRGLDPVNRRRLARVLAERTRQGKATVIASHHAWVAEMAHRTVDLGEPTPSTPPRARRAEVVYA